jgi:hypothetical protein
MHLRKIKVICVTNRAVQDYDLYLIHYDYFELLRLYHDSLHIQSSLITVEYNTI